jgi:hypothetical protein
VRDAVRLAKRRADRAASEREQAARRRAEPTASRYRQNARRRAERAAKAELRRAAAERAAAWLLRYLLAAGGRASYRAIVIAAEDSGHSPAACRAAQRMLALRSDRGHGCTDWALPR